MKRTSLLYIPLGLALITLVACGSSSSGTGSSASNPILGKWAPKVRGGMEAVPMEFTSAEQIDTASKDHWPVTYDIKGNEVTVKTENPALGRTCTVSGDSMHCKNPVMGEFDMVRDK